MEEKCVDIGLDIEFAEENKKKFLAKIEMIEQKEAPIKKSLLELAGILTGVDHGDESSSDLVDICTLEIEKLLRSLAGENITKITEDMEDIGFKPSGPAFEDTYK